MTDRMTDPTPAEGRAESANRWVDWIDPNATDDRCLYAVVDGEVTVADLRAVIADARREGFNECAQRTLDAIRRDRGVPEGEPLLTITYDEEAAS